MTQFSNIRTKYTVLTALILASLLSTAVYGHGVDDSTRTFLTNNTGIQIAAFLYIGAKHMVTGYDHLLFLVGVIFFLFKARDVLVYVSMFTLGHSLTLLFGVFGNIEINAYLIDAIIGFSVAYKGFDNLGGFKHVPIKMPNPKIVVLVFGLFHGFGLATKLQEFELQGQGLVANLLAFNIGVELGQFTALAIILIFISFWRRHQSFSQFSITTNILLMTAGFSLTGYQLSAYFLSQIQASS